MESALIVGCTEKSAALFTGMLNEASVRHITVLKSGGEARRILPEKNFDLVIINTPLADESGEGLSRYIAAKNLSQVILVVKKESFDEVSSTCEDNGVLIIAKPVSREIFWSALSLAKSARNRIQRIQAENTQLKQKIEDIRIIDRAKCLLISYLNLSEQESHRFIEKQAMDLRSSKRAIAEGILKTYAS